MERVAITGALATAQLTVANKRWGILDGNVF